MLCICVYRPTICGSKSSSRRLSQCLARKNLNNQRNDLVMQKNLGTKLIVIVVVIVAFMALIFLGNDWGKSIQAIRQHGVEGGLRESIHLGLDLKGGVHLILQVKVNEAVSSDSDHAAEVVREQLQKKNVSFTNVSKPDSVNRPEVITVKGLTADAGQQLRTIVQDFLPDYDASRGSEDEWNVVMKPTRQASLKQETLNKSIDAIRTRVDALGVSEPVIQENGLGNYQILVQLPGVDDPERVKDIIKSTARLELHQCFGSVGGYESEEAAGAANGTPLPFNQTLVHGRSVGSRSDGDRVYVVAKTAIVGGTDVRSAEAGHKSDSNQPVVNFFLTNAAGRKFGDFTREHNEESGAANSCLAIILDSRVIEAANIKSQINDEGLIEGGFTEQSAKDLATLLTSGALPASMSFLADNTVGPSLGADSIRSGVKAAIGGMLAVMIFMFIYYRGAGVNANLALIFNLVILLGCMGLFGAVLTLPGLAGVILTVGMGVDSNVLIFERIREELRSGK